MLAGSCTVTAISLPAAIASIGGWVRGVLLVMLCVAMNSHVSVLIWRITMCCPGHTHYGELIYAAFEGASRQKRLYAKAITEFATWGFIFVSTSYNVLVIGEAIGWSFDTWRYCLPTLMLIGTVFNITLQTPMRSLGEMPWVFWVNTVTIILIVAIPLLHYASLGVASSRILDGGVAAMAHAPMKNQLQGCSTLVFMMATQYVNTEMISEMSDPREFPKTVCCLAAPCQVIFILVAGVVGYYYLGNYGTQNSTDYLPFGLELQVTSFAIILNCIINNLLNCVCMCHKIHEIVDGASLRGTLRDWIVWTTIVVALLLSSWFVANIVPHIQDFANLFGSSLGPLSCYVIPILTYVWVYNHFDEHRVPRISVIEWVVIAAWFALSILLIFYGTYTTLQSVAAHWETNGRPFECHCNLKWDTCSCSASRPGMECPAFVK